MAELALHRDPEAVVAGGRPLHVAYLVQQFPPEVGAGPARVFEMATRWRDAGATVTVVTGMPNRPQGRIYDGYRGRLFMDEEMDGIRVVRSWLYASPAHGFARTVANNLSFLATGLLSSLFRLERPDVLIASSPPFFPHVSGTLAAGLRGIPLVLEVRDLWPDYLVGMGVLRAGGVPARVLFDLERLLLQRAGEVVVVTESFGRRMREKGVRPDRIHVIPNGVDRELYFPSSEPAPFPEMERNGSFVVGYLGNFGAGQGLEHVLDAADRLGDQGVRFVLAGDGPERDRLVARVRERALDHVSIHGAIPKSATRAFYNACDLCLVPLAPISVFQETIPSKLFEILACGRPVLAALGGEGARVVRDSGAGIVVPPGDGAALADAVRDLQASGNGRLARMGGRGPAWVEERFGRDRLASRYLELLRRVAGEGAVSTDVGW